MHDTGLWMEGKTRAAAVLAGSDAMWGESTIVGRRSPDAIPRAAFEFERLGCVGECENASVCLIKFASYCCAQTAVEPLSRTRMTVGTDDVRSSA